MTEERLAAVIASELTGSARSQTAVNDIAFALVLDLHQPAGNLDDLRRTGPWAAAEILHAIDRIPRSLRPYQDTGGVQLSLSGTLPADLTDPGFQRRPLRHRPGRRGPRRCSRSGWRIWCRRPAGSRLRVTARRWWWPALP